MTLIKNIKNLLKNISYIYKQELKSVKIILLLAVLFNILFFMLPIIIQIIINQIVLQIYGEVTFSLFIILFLISFIIFHIKIIQMEIIEKLQRRLFVGATTQYVNFFSSWQPKSHDKIRSQDYFHKFFEIFTFQKTSVRFLKDSFQLLLQIIFGLIIISLYHPFFFLYSVCFTVLIFFSLKILGSNILGEKYELSNKKYDFLAWLEQIAVKRDLFLGSKSSDFANTILGEKVDNYFFHRFQYFKSYSFQVKLVFSIQIIMGMLLLIIGGYLVSNEQLSLGQLVAAEIIITGILIGFGNILNILDDFYTCTISAAKLYEVMEESNFITDGDIPCNFKNHHWKVKKSQLEFELLPGQKYVLHSEEGKGKTSLLNLMMKYKILDSTHRITLNDHNLTNIESVSFYNHIQLLRDDVDLFDGTIFDNLTRGNSLISNEKINEIITLVGLRKTIEKFPEQIQTKINMSGAPLSETQAKILMVARALLSQPNTLLIDCLFDGMQDDIKEKLITVVLKSPITVLVTTNSKTVTQYFPNKIEWQ